MNLNGVSDWSTNYPFLNFAKQARRWLAQQEGAPWGKGGELELDGDGWVRSLEPGQAAEMFFLTIAEGPLPFGRFIVRYEGVGKISYRLAASKVGKCGPLCDVVSVSGPVGSYGVLRIDDTDRSNHIRNISIVPEKYIREFDKGEVFNPIWIERLSGLRAIRFMDWAKTNDSKQGRWENRPQVTDASWAWDGVPLEIMIQLANRLGADPWFNIPHLADEIYIRKFAEVVRRSLRPNLKVYVEHSNEVWNWQFEQAQYANKTGRARWGDVGDAFMQWHGMRTAEICDIWKTGAFSGAPNRVVCVLGVQAGWKGLEKAALDCPKWTAEGHAPCYRHNLDAIAIAGYFSGCLNGKTDGRDSTDVIRSWFADSDAGLRKAFEQLTDGRHFSCSDTVAGMRDVYRYFKEVADNHGLSLVAYEGGQHVTGNASSVQDDPRFIDFHIAVNRDARMGDLYKRNFNLWKDAGGSLFMHFLDIQPPSKWGSWGALEYLNQASSPKWRAIRSFNDDVPCWWEGCE